MGVSIAGGDAELLELIEEALDRYVALNLRAEVEAERDAKVPLRNKTGTSWDVANAALFLAFDDGSFITGVTLPVDGGASVRRG